MLTLYKALRVMELGNRHELNKWLKQKAALNIVNDRCTKKIIDLASPISLLARADNLLAVLDVNELSLYDINTKKLWAMPFRLHSEQGTPRRLILNEEGFILCIASSRHGTCVQIVRQGETTGSFLLTIQSYCQESLHLTNQRILGFHHDGTFHEWTITGELVQTFKLADCSLCIDLRSASNEFYYVVANGIREDTNAILIFFYDLSTNVHHVQQLQNRIPGSYQAVDAMILSNDKLMLATHSFRMFEGRSGWLVNRVQAKISLFHLADGTLVQEFLLPSALAVQQITADDKLIVAYGIFKREKEQIYLIDRHTGIRSPHWYASRN